MGLLTGNSGASSSYFNSLRSGDQFPDPFMDMASTAMPESIQDALRWAEFIWMSHGIYRQAMNRVVAYFLTPIEFVDTDASNDEKEKFKTFFEEQVDVYMTLMEVACDYMAYGNSFTSLLTPFRRYLSCPESGCGHEAPLRIVFNTASYRFKWKNYDFYAKCPKCDYEGRFDHVDRRCGEEEKVIVKRWNPHEMYLVWDHLTDQVQYVWKIPAEYRQQIQRGDSLFILERAHWEVIEAIKHNNDLLFDDGVVHHMKDPCLAGIKNRGWGIPRIIPNFRQAWYVQVLHRYNEAIALDYVIPFRVLTPVPKAGGTPESGDPVLGMNMGDFSARVRGMLRQHRRNPTTWHTLPFPVQYQALGGEASQMAPYQLLELGRNDLLNSSGVPQELYAGTLSVQAVPTALRLFQNLWTPLVHNLNQFLAWLVKSVAEYHSWEPVSARLSPVTIADDIQKQLAILQLMAGKQVSQTTGLRTLGKDFKEEQTLMVDEQKFVSEKMQEMQEDMSAKQNQQMMAAQPMQAGPAGGDPSQGGMPGMPPQQAPTDATNPQDLLTQADQIAQELLGMDETQRRSEMMAIKKENPTLHSVVKSRMEDIRTDSDAAGGAQVRAQTFGQ